MIKDIQCFDAIFQDEDTELETVEVVAIDLSEVDALGVNTGICWKNAKPKTNLITKSGNEFVILEAFENVVHLWNRYKQQEKKNSLRYLNN